MSEGRETITVKGAEPTPPLDRGELKARIARVLDRAMSNDRLKVDLPDGVYGEWVPDDPFEISRFKDMGFDIDREYAKSLHNVGDGSRKVADVIFMTCPREVYDIITEVRNERYYDSHGKKGDKVKAQREEKEFNTNAPLPMINESSASAATKAQIAEALNRDVKAK